MPFCRIWAEPCWVIFARVILFIARDVPMAAVYLPIIIVLNIQSISVFIFYAIKLFLMIVDER